MLVWTVFGTSLILKVVHQTQPILTQEQFGCLPFDIVPWFLVEHCYRIQKHSLW